MAKIIRKQQAALIAAGNGICHPEWSARFIIQNIHRTDGIKVDVIRMFHFDLLYYDFAEVTKNKSRVTCIVPSF